MVQPPPGRSTAMLRARAALRDRIRAFFAAREVLEIDTPLLAHSVVVEAMIDPIEVVGGGGFLQASPEAAMKRWLAAGSGPIWQLAPAFRSGEEGRRHSPEFTMLEWYRPGFDLSALMSEVEELVRWVLPDRELLELPFDRCSYRELFVTRVGLDPFGTTRQEVLALCEERSIPIPPPRAGDSLDDALDLLLTGVIEPELGRGPLFIHGYPASQAALARVEADGTAARFELYVDGVELANGYHELADPVEKRERFVAANARREADGREALPVDEELLAALGEEFPDCSGVALGFDRLLMLAVGAADIDAVRGLP